MFWKWCTWALLSSWIFSNTYLWVIQIYSNVMLRGTVHILFVWVGGFSGYVLEVRPVVSSWRSDIDIPTESTADTVLHLSPVQMKTRYWGGGITSSSDSTRLGLFGSMDDRGMSLQARWHGGDSSLVVPGRACHRICGKVLGHRYQDQGTVWDEMYQHPSVHSSL